MQFDFLEFEQYPLCNYTLSYSLTVVQKSTTAFSKQLAFNYVPEGFTPEPTVAEIDPLTRVVTIYPDNEDYGGETFWLYINAHLNENLSYQEDVTQLADLVTLNLYNTLFNMPN